MSSRSRNLFDAGFRRCSPSDRRQLVQGAIREMEACLEYPGNDRTSIRRRIAYVKRRAREYGAEADG